jgi:hypothetical protein
MTSASMSFGRPARLRLPSASLWLAAGASMLIEGLRRLDRWQLSAGRQEPRTAEEVLEWAARIERREPGFASDLRAAALRAMDGVGR